jgi:hypothetical protein
MQRTNMNNEASQPGSPTTSLSTLFEETRDQRTDKSLQPGSTATPFSTFFWAALKATLKTTPEADDWVIPEAQFADDVEWDMMNNGQIRKGKQEVIPFLKAGGYGSHKDPVAICNVATKEWGVWEYWNIGTLSEEIVDFARQSKWSFPGDPRSLIGRTYKIPVCFVYHLNAQGKIDLVREYLDTQSLMTQFE